MPQSLRGYTLLELLAVLVITALLFSLATPSLSSIVRRTEAETRLQTLIGAAQLARSTAISQRQPTVLCATADSFTCHSDWTQGAMVFVDTNDNRKIDGDERVLLQLPATPKGSRLIMRAALNKQYLRYMSNGMLENTAGSFLYCAANASAREARNVIFNRSGRLRFGSDKNRDGIPENAEGQPLSCPS
ncbi:MAG: GspH/FimT family pseudopilin [Pseudomonadales bacterium]|nr:GspH/FimT family pseudopilin [Pseudomonadales bacterium]